MFESEHDLYENDNETNEEYQPLLLCKLVEISILNNNLIPLLLTKDQTAKIIISSSGLLFTVMGGNKSIQAQSFIDSSLFQAFTFKPIFNNKQKLKENENESENGNGNLNQNLEKEKVYEMENNNTKNTKHILGNLKNNSNNHEENADLIILRVNLSVFLECLNVFETKKGAFVSQISTVVQLVFPSPNGSLEIDLENSGLVARSEINVLACDFQGSMFDLGEELYFDSSTVKNTLVMDSLGLRLLLSELDWDSEKIIIAFVKQPSMLVFQTFSPIGKFQLECPTSSEAVNSFLSHITQKFDYLSRSLSYVAKSLQYSTKVSLRMNELGTLSLQLMIENSTINYSFIEFLILPVTEEGFEENFEIEED
ncbi:cell cycle checkpoint protein rad1 [Anaeramoeba flamelloides]|uniref:Cell cycle checkpoint protein rad1 n=1 Tax=Anaeramoeba flamelloides TaxID=1746091 RepID=A0AAV7YNZ5_9EUKA|nr:cell cycle checkpoint protein rad1 [Anaeramoeba flamelloides]